MGDVVRCNYCEAVFTDEEITVIDDQEVCPKCGESGCIMDMAGAWQ